MNRPLIILLCGAVSFLASAQSQEPALLPPDGKSHRGDKMVGHTLTKPADIAALGKLYQDTKDFESRQEYFLRLLDYFWFSQHRLIGMKRADIEAVFGAGHPQALKGNANPRAIQLQWVGGRDILAVSFDGEIATGAAYIMGF